MSTMYALLHSIKLTSHINPRAGYDARPRFDTEVWTLFARHKAEVEDVCFFANSFWHGGDRQTFAQAGESAHASAAQAHSRS
jgi:hypothetical protein